MESQSSQISDVRMTGPRPIHLIDLLTSANQVNRLNHASGLVYRGMIHLIKAEPMSLGPCRALVEGRGRPGSRYWILDRDGRGYPSRCIPDLDGYPTLHHPGYTTTAPDRLVYSCSYAGTDKRVLWAQIRECVTLNRHLKSI